MGRNSQINIKVTKDRRGRWKDAAEDQNRSLSNLIRYAVEQEINSESDPVSNTTGNSQKIDTVIEHLQSLEASISGGPGSLSHRLQAIKGQLVNDPQAQELATAVYGLLPNEDQLTTLPDLDDPSARIGENGRVVTGNPEHIAQYMCYSPDIDADPSSTQVQQALDDLRGNLHNVQQLPDGRCYRS